MGRSQTPPKSAGGKAARVKVIDRIEVRYHRIRTFYPPDDEARARWRSFTWHEAEQLTLDRATGILELTYECDSDKVAHQYRLVGQVRETGPLGTLRSAWYQSVDYAGGVNADAIRGEILQNVEGVYSAIVYENDTDETDSEGLPPHSIEAVVYGGLDSDVAQQIFRRKAAGIQTYGSTSVAVLSSSGVTYNIKFSRPTLVPVWIKVTDLETDANRFPVDGKDQIAQALIDYIGSDVKGGTTIGETVYYNRLPEVIYTIPGVLDFTLQTSPDGSDYGTYNIEVDTREKAYTEKAKVSVS